MANMKTENCDVLIIGTGIGGTVLGAILARHGLKVIMVDAVTHPRFAVGESTIPTTTQTLEVMALRYDVPELNHITNITQVSEHVVPTSGLKRNFGFVYHREHSPQDPAEANQVMVVNEVHFFRQDIDAYMLHIAVRYGCRVHQNVSIDDVQFLDDGVVASAARSGLQIRARYVADGAGYRSVLSEKLGLREQPTRCKTHARGLFTHMIDVIPYDECRSVAPELQQPIPWHQGTLHHIFDGGWMWVIPFNNNQYSKNQLVSVGLMLDPRKYPKSDLDGEAEFAGFLERYPSIAVQFTKAKAVREWVSAGRIQYSSKACVGERYCLLSHAAGFIDPLFSRGLFNTMQTTNVLANILLSAFKDNDFSVSRFARVEELQQGLIDFNDTVVNCSYIAFRHYPLWNAWFRLWMLTGHYGRLRTQRALLKYKETRDRLHLESLDEGLPGSYTKQESLMRLFQNAARIVEQVDEGKIGPDVAERAIYSLLEDNRELLPPFFAYTSPAERMTQPHPPEKIAAMVRGWVSEMSPAFREEYFDYNIEALFQQAVVKDSPVIKTARDAGVEATSQRS